MWVVVNIDIVKQIASFLYIGNQDHNQYERKKWMQPSRLEYFIKQQCEYNKVFNYFLEHFLIIE